MAPAHQKIPSKRKRRILILFGTLGWLFGILALLALTTSAWLPWVVNQWNKDGNKWDQFEFKLAHIDAHQAKIKDVHFQKEGISIESDGITLSYQPTRIVKGELDSILVDPLKIKIDLSVRSSDSPVDDISHQRSISETFAHLSTPLPPLPFKELLAGDIRILLEKDQEEILNATLQTHASLEDEILTTQASLHMGDDSVRLNSKISAVDVTDRSLNMSFHLWDPMDLLTRITALLPQEQASIIQQLNLQLGPIYSSLDTIAQKDLITAQVMAKHLAIPDQFQLNDITLIAESTTHLQSFEGLLGVERVDLPNRGSFKIEGGFKIENALSSKPSLHSKWDVFPFMMLSEDGSENPVSDGFDLEIDFEAPQASLSIPSFYSTLLPVQLLNIHADVQLPTEESGIQYAANVDLKPLIAGWEIHTEGHNLPITLTLTGKAEKEITGIESFQNTIQLPLPKIRVQSEIPSSDSNTPYKLTGSISGQVSTNQNGKTASSNVNLTLNDFRFSQANSFNLSLNATIDSEAAIDLKTNWQQFDFTRDLKDPKLTLQLDGKGKIEKTSFSIVKLELMTPHLEPLTQSDDSLPLTAKADRIKWDVWKLLNPKTTGFIDNDKITLRLLGNLLDPSIDVTADYQFNWTTGSQDGWVEAKSNASNKRSTLALQKLFPTMSTTIVSAALSATMQIVQMGESIQLPLDGSVLDGTLTLPDAGLSVEGIQLPSFRFKDLITGESEGSFDLKIASIDYSPTNVSDLTTTFQIEPGYALNIENLQFKFCGGSFRVIVEESIAAPYDRVSFKIEFSEVDIKQLTALIPDFKENLSGKLDGTLPFKLSKGEISWGKGTAHLTPETTARLQYAENGVFASYIPEIVISKDLNININEALRDIILTELSIEIQSSSQFDQPSVVIMSGRSNNSKIEIPIERIQLNIRAGEIPGLLNRSFNSRSWFESLLFSE